MKSLALASADFSWKRVCYYGNSRIFLFFTFSILKFSGRTPLQRSRSCAKKSAPRPPQRLELTENSRSLWHCSTRRRCDAHTRFAHNIEMKNMINIWISRWLPAWTSLWRSTRGRVATSTCASTGTYRGTYRWTTCRYANTFAQKNFFLKNRYFELQADKTREDPLEYFWSWWLKFGLQQLAI